MPNKKIHREFEGGQHDEKHLPSLTSAALYAGCPSIARTWACPCPDIRLDKIKNLHPLIQA